MRQDLNLLRDLGRLLRQARERAGMTQEQVATRAGLSRLRYRTIEAGEAAARATTLINIARALDLELMLIPKPMLPAVQAMLRPADDQDRPAFVPDRSDDDEEGEAQR
ncbi:helix-turn-helix transcriptional regulator [Pseudolabrys sp. FHR47]|uniref:helix-turn-helix transcriptional regulator n=1 Tax=Pseudolabrys sp. FHR47 TaxID=2562284 RepID=UPI0010BF4874|nr:helix-turn-helix transcriptional regulator [Pseudolabrys sp. FHR47]